MVQILRLQEIALGPGNAFIKCVMATCDHPSGLVHGIAYPSLGRPGFRTHWQLPLPEEEKRSSASSSLQEEAGDLFCDSLIASGKSRRRNPWATVGALGFQLLLLLALVVIPLFHTDPLPKRETLTMLYLQPLPAAGGNATKLRAPKSTSTYIPTSTGIPTPAHETQEAPPPPVGTTSGVEFLVEWPAAFPAEY